MKKAVLTFVKPAKELKVGDQILTNRMTVVEIESTEAFENSQKHPCIAITYQEGCLKSGSVFLSDDSVLVLE